MSCCQVLDLMYLARVPFEELQLQFESGDRIRVLKRESPDSRLMCEIVLNSETHEAELFAEPDPAVIQEITSRLGMPWRYSGRREWVDLDDGEVLDFNTVLARLARVRGPLPDKLVQSLAPKDNPLLDKIRAKCKVRLIGTDRLLSKPDPDVSPPFEAWLSRPGRLSSSGLRRDVETKTIALYSRDLRRRVRDVLSSYGTPTERFDRSLVRRLLGPQRKPITPDELLDRFKDLDQKRQKLTSLGLLTETEDILGGRASDKEVLTLVKGSQDVFSLYVLDMQEKLALFDELQGKLEVLRSRTDKRFQFKKLVIDPAEGFVFTSEAWTKETKLPVSELSSGEQHEMILLYELLFMADEVDLVLIDEPEISLHVEWQMELLDDLKAALSSSNVHVLMATHSPAIAQGAGDVVLLGPRAG
jgi:hypothetical protein